MYDDVEQAGLYQNCEFHFPKSRGFAQGGATLIT
jgi:hypothetical protein